MKKFNLFLFLMAFFCFQFSYGQTLALSVCNGNIGTNNYGTPNSNTSANAKARGAFIIPASQLISISDGTISATYLKRYAATGTMNANSTFKIYLKNVTVSTWGTGALDWATATTGATLVYNANPDTAIGSSAGWKKFQHSTNFVYTAGSNLAVFTEYEQTTAQASTINWEYEYSSPCVNTSDSNTTKYATTTGTMPATLTSSDYRRPHLGFDATIPPATAAPNCTTVTAPANAAVNVSLNPTITWPQVAYATSYLVSIGTTAGGTDILNNVDVGLVSSYTLPAANTLSFNTQYYVTVSPKNNIGSAVGCTSNSFTTMNISCPTVSYPGAAATGVSRFTNITWAAINGATGYRLSVGTTSGGTDILNNVDLGNVTTYNFTTPLAASTTYYYSVNSYAGSISSTSCSVRSFTTTAALPPANDDCANAVTLPVSSNLTCGTATSGNTLGASMSMAATPCSGNPDDDVWYQFVATSTSHIITLSNVVSTGTSTSTDMYMQLLSGTCGTFTSLYCSDPNTLTANNLTIGSTYYIRVYTFSAGGYNASFNICVTTPPAPPANDNCAGAIALTPGTTFDQNAVIANNVSATLTTDTTATTTCQTTRYADVWYSVVVPASGSITIETKSVSGSPVTDTVLGVYTGSCGSLVVAGCDDDSSDDGNFSMITLTGQTPGSTLLIAVFNYSSTNMGDFRISAYHSTVLGTSEAVADKKQVQLYPNPFVNELNINDISRVKSLSIVDLSGKLIRTIEKVTSTIQLGDLPSGMYLVQIQNVDGSVQSLKVVKK